MTVRWWPWVAILAAGLAAVPTSAQVAPSDANADKRCLQCHAQAKIAELGPEERRSMVGTWLGTDAPPPKSGDAKAPEAPSGPEPAKRPKLFVQAEDLASGPHALGGKVRCVDCHPDAATLPHAAKLEKATCAASCHEAAVKAYDTGAHHEAFLRKDPLAPTCTSCHGAHDILKVSDRKSPQYKLNSVHLCGDCHKKHQPNGDGIDPSTQIGNYLDSAHARAVVKAGLPMAATCADCHGAHGVRGAEDPDSPVARANVPETCGKCHVGVLEIYAQSVHGRKHAESNGKAAVCTDCHTAHQISQASAPGFILDVLNECGRCHDSKDASSEHAGTYYRSYAESYHGQVTKLGGTRAARCSDCHGSHDIRPLDDPASRVAQANLVETCGTCHPKANASFVRFDPHANFRDAEKYPLLHGVWLYFMVVMSTVFTFFGVHTILWFVRSMADRLRHGKHPHPPKAATAIRRFNTIDRINHAFVALTFFGLTATGIPLVFASQDWARQLANLVGGIEAAGLWHRFFAALLIANLTLHFLGLARNFLNRNCSAKEWVFGPNSLFPRWKDVTDCVGMFRWFFGLGKQPKFDRWTYWEKFDYWAEVGGSVIIGGSGLLLWFPELASRILPGWSFNVAMIVHGYEALLAIGFIFTIHFFNAHLRPGTFPVDEVIFTGSLPEAELKEQRPAEYERLVATGRLDALRVPAPNHARRPVIVGIAVVSVGIGLILLALIIIGGLH